ncbi:unnamed protein product [Auanema sp. JU1783]|nr:unnamed protein product [Auanema sp. JU1783]
MFRTSQLYVRSRGLLSFLSPKQQEPTQSLSPSQQKELRSALENVRTDAPRKGIKSEETGFDADLLVDGHIDIDSIRARGQMKYMYNYKPPSNVKETILNISKKVLSVEKTGNVLEFRLSDDVEAKAKLIVRAGEHFNHFPTNSALLRIKNVEDLIEFYNTPVENINSYAKLARKEGKPLNVHVIEQPVRYNPNDTDSWHGGITAFPGTGGQVISLRNKRLLRQFKPKEDWFDYEDQTFDYKRPDEDMPWDAEITKKMDRYPDRRYNLSTKSFKRV